MVDVKERPKARNNSSGDAVPDIRKVGVIGAGQMGNGIAHVCALSGFNVLLNDIAVERISEGLATIGGNLARQVSRQRISDADREAALNRIAPAHTLSELGDCDLVIEAATEKEEVKRKIFTAVCARSSRKRWSALPPRRSRSRGWRRRPTGRSGSSAFIL